MDRLAGAGISLQSVGPVVVFKQKCDGIVVCLRSIFLAVVWKAGRRGPEEGQRADQQAIAIVQERLDGGLGTTMTVRTERRRCRHAPVVGWMGMAPTRGWL